MDPAADDAEAVLEAFIRRHPMPTAGEVADWVARHPGHAEAIRRFAVDVVETTLAGGGEPGSTPEVEELDRYRSIALDVAARHAAEVAAGGTLADVARRAGTNIPRLADALDVAREVLSDLDAGAVALPVGRRIVDALAQALGRGRQQVLQAIEAAFRSPRIGFAKSDDAPTMRRRTWEETVASSPMSEERKAHWLDRD